MNCVWEYSTGLTENVVHSFDRGNVLHEGTIKFLDRITNTISVIIYFLSLIYIHLLRAATL